MISKKLGSVILAVVIVMMMSSISLSAETNIGVDISTVGMGARPIALGSAFTGMADDASAIFTNPAGLGLQNRLSFISMSTQILTCVDYTLAGVTVPTEYGTFGFGYVGASTQAGNYIYYDSVGTTMESGAMSYSDQMVILSYGRDISSLTGGINNLSFGTNVKVISKGLSGAMKNAPSASGYEMDLGLIYAASDKLSLGATLQNAAGSVNWSTGERQKLPTLLKLGSSYKALDNVTTSLDTDFDLDGQKSMVFHAGTEWQVIPMLALRAGVDQKNGSIDEEKGGVVTNYSIGLGVMYEGFRFDYAYKLDPIFSELSTHYFSISYFGEPNIKQQKTEKSIIAEQPVKQQASEVKPLAVVVEKDESVKEMPKNKKIDTDKDKKEMMRKLGVPANNSDSDDVLSQYERLIESSKQKKVAQR